MFQSVAVRRREQSVSQSVSRCVTVQIHEEAKTAKQSEQSDIRLQQGFCIIVLNTIALDEKKWTTRFIYYTTTQADTHLAVCAWPRETKGTLSELLLPLLLHRKKVCYYSNPKQLHWLTYNAIYISSAFLTLSHVSITYLILFTAQGVTEVVRLLLVVRIYWCYEDWALWALSPCNLLQSKSTKT